MAPLLEELSVTMKSCIGVTIGILLIALSVWLVDIDNDQSKTVKVESVVSAYNSWECGGQQTIDCKVVFETEANKSYDIKRIRYGKDFMAIQIMQAGASGWIFSSNEVQVIAVADTKQGKSASPPWVLDSLTLVAACGVMFDKETLCFEDRII